MCSERKEDSDISSDDGSCDIKHQQQRQRQHYSQMLLNPSMSMSSAIQETNNLATAYSNQLTVATTPGFNFPYNTNQSMQYIPSADMLYMTSYQSL